MCGHQACESLRLLALLFGDRVLPAQLFYQHTQLRVPCLDLCFKQLAARDVVADERGSDDGARGVAQRRNHHREHSSLDRKSTRLNSSHANISYAVFCLKKKKKN